MSNPSHKIIIIAAPSGAGKTSVVHHLLKTLPQRLGFSVSCATRSPRANEKNGVDYYFIAADEFKQRIEKDEFAEWEMVYEGKYYGTLRSELTRIWDAQKVPLLDVDVKGGLAVKRNYPNSLSIFIEPPSIEELKRRLESRGTESPASLQARIEKATWEMTFRSNFDTIVVNDNLTQTCEVVEKLVLDYLNKI
ncbi:MAG: guanylate kinase [Chitinophagaceae bacterium]